MPTYKIQLRRDSASNWSSSNPTLASGEIGIDTTAQAAGTAFMKVGDGSTAWNSLGYSFPTFANPTSGANNYAPIASPTFTGLAKAPDLTVEDTDGNDPTLTILATGSTSTVLKHDSIVCSGAITGTTLTGTSLSVTASAHGGSHLVPTGTIMPFAGLTAPTGYKFCDGASLNTFTNKDLHAVISNKFGGTAYNAGVTDQDGVSTTFKLPDLRGRVIAGHNKMDSADNDLAGSSSGLLLTSNRDRTVTKNTFSSATSIVVDAHPTEAPLVGDVLVGSGTQGTISNVSVADIDTTVYSAGTGSGSNAVTESTVVSTELKRYTLTLTSSDLTEESTYTLRTVVGVDGNTFGSTGGDDVHTLGLSEMPSHSHDTLRSNSFSASGGAANHPYKAPLVERPTTAEGGSLAHNIVQPTMILNYMIKT